MRRRRPYRSLTTLPWACGLAAFVWAAVGPSGGGPPARAAYVPDPFQFVPHLGVDPVRSQARGRNESADPSPAYAPEDRRQLVSEGKELFSSTTAWGQLPSDGPQVSGERLSCSSCHSGIGFSDNRTHVVGPVRNRQAAPRQTPALFGLAGSAPFGWDGRNATLPEQARGAITSPLEMKAAREPTRRELDALTEFMLSLTPPPAKPGVDFDQASANRGEKLFRQKRQIVDPSGEFGPAAEVSCDTCHSGPFLTDRKPHRIGLPGVPFGDPAVDPGATDKGGNIVGFDTPSLLGLRFTAPYFHDGAAGDPTGPGNLLGGGAGASAAEGDSGAQGATAARRALRDNVLPFYNSVRFQFGFTQAELDDLTEFLLSL